MRGSSGGRDVIRVPSKITERLGNYMYGQGTSDTECFYLRNALESLVQRDQNKTRGQTSGRT